MTELFKITCLGTGAAFTENNWQSNFLLSHNDKNLLVDFIGFLDRGIVIEL